MTTATITAPEFTIPTTNNAPSDAVVIDSPDGAFLMLASSGNLRLSLARSINDAKRILRK